MGFCLYWWGFSCIGKCRFLCPIYCRRIDCRMASWRCIECCGSIRDHNTALHGESCCGCCLSLWRQSADQNIILKSILKKSKNFVLIDKSKKHWRSKFNFMRNKSFVLICKRKKHRTFLLLFESLNHETFIKIKIRIIYTTWSSAQWSQINVYWFKQF